MAVTDFSSPSFEKRLIESDFYLRGGKKIIHVTEFKANELDEGK